MIKNKAFSAMIIGTCIFVNSMAGVYADTTPALDTPVSIQIEQVKSEDPLTNKQSEIDQYVFEKHVKDFEEKGITVTHTGVISDYVEVGILPYTDENADYLYDIFGKDQVKVVSGENYMLMVTTSGPVAEPQPEIVMAEETSAFTAFFNNIVDWFKSIF